MTDSPANQPTAAALADAAGVAELAAAAEVDGLEGDGLLAALVRHEVALGHRLAMQFAAAGNAALDIALAPAADAAAAKAADRQAARLGGAAARVMGNVRLTLRTLGGLPATAAPDEQWIGVRFEDEPACSPAEAVRRLAAAQAAAPTAAPPAATTAPDTAAALAAAADLAAEAGVAALAPATADAGALKTLLRHELAAAHRLAMRCGGRAGRLLAQAQPADDQIEALRLASASARLMARGRQALAALPQLDPVPAGGPHGGPGGGGRPRIAGYYWLGEHDLLEHDSGEKTGGRGRKAPASASSAGGIAAQSTRRLANRGHLRNGNPSGDFLAAPRCGARTRAGCPCRQPAMANGRCRFHGGKSTGPRTAAGLARSRAARRTHGGHSAEIIDLRQAAAAHARRVAALAQFGARQKATPADNPAPPAPLIVPSAGAFGRRPAAPQAPLPAGHGVHPLFFMARPSRRQVR